MDLAGMSSNGGVYINGRRAGVGCRCALPEAEKQSIRRVNQDLILRFRLRIREAGPLFQAEAQQGFGAEWTGPF